MVIVQGVSIIALFQHKKRRNTMQGTTTMAWVDEGARQRHNEHVE